MSSWQLLEQRSWSRSSGSFAIARQPPTYIASTARTSCSSRSTRCAPTPSAATAGRAATPALDRLAADGVRFDFAHAHAVLTLPSHASILTGTYPFQHGMRDNSGYRLPPARAHRRDALARCRIRDRRVRRRVPLHSRFGLNAGFDVYDDRLRRRHARRPSSSCPSGRPRASSRSRETGSRPGGSSRPPAASHEPPPWFAWVHVFDPHAPYRPPPPFDSSTPRPVRRRGGRDRRGARPAARRRAHPDWPTLVIVTGDHGEALGDHGEQTHGLFAYESTLRIPLIIAELGSRLQQPFALGGVSPGRSLTSLPGISTSCRPSWTPWASRCHRTCRAARCCRPPSVRRPLRARRTSRRCRRCSTAAGRHSAACSPTATST